MKNVQYALVWQRLATVLAVAVLTLSLIAAVTGILLAFYYEPTAGGAYESLRVISTQVSNGWLIQNLHSIAGNGIIALSLVQIVVMFLGERMRPSWLTAWISGILLTLTAIALGWTAMILSWNQLGYWRFKIELETIQAIPLIGPSLREILTGGGAVNTITVEHLYTLHSYLLAIGAVLLAVIHLSSLLLQEKENRQADIRSANLDAELS
jgi:cytochrome b6